MSTKRLGVAVAVLGGYLYAVGGSDGSSPLNSGKPIIDHFNYLTFAFYQFWYSVDVLKIWMNVTLIAHFNVVNQFGKSS